MHEIRNMTKGDAQGIARLLTLLGHKTTLDDINNRWENWTSEGNVGFVVEKDDGTLGGLITLHKMFVLHRPQFVGRITALVVDEQLRGQGIGRKLVAVAEVHFKKLECGLLEITSHKKLKQAHLFYEHLDYERTSERFGKILTKIDVQT